LEPLWQPWPGVSPTAILNEEKALGTRLKTGDNCCRLVQFAKQILAISLAVRGFHAGLQGYLEPSISDKLACEREFDNCFDKFAIKVVNNGETVDHLPHEFSKIAWYRYVFDFILVMIHGKLQIVLADKPHPRF